MKYLILTLLLSVGCHYSQNEETLSLVQIQDRNGLTETVSHPERLSAYKNIDFLSSQPYKKVVRIFKTDEKNRSVITTYHPNGTIAQYLEAEEMRANGAYREWFANGKLKLEAKVINGTADLNLEAQNDWVFDSISTVYDDQGNLFATIPYCKGVLEGKSTYYYPNQNVQKEFPFEKDRLEGTAFEYWPDGSLKWSAEFRKGVKEGKSVSYYSHGIIAAEEFFSDDRLASGTYYSPFGDFISEVVNGGGFKAEYQENELVLIEYKVGLPDGLMQKFRKSGNLYLSFHLKGGMKHGEEIEYYEPDRLLMDGEKPLPKISIQWNENAIHGVVKTWYENGQLQSQREYCQNKKMGPHLAWYRNGNLMLFEEYEDNCLVNGQYYKITQKDPISSVLNGNGIATIFDENGLTLRKITYVKGKPVDPEE